MYKLCKTEQSARRQRQLEDGLLAAMMTQSFNDISISDLCDHMNIPRKSFYRYFSSKDGALCALIDHRIMEFNSQPRRCETKEEALQRLTLFFEFWKTQKPLLEALARNGMSSVLLYRATVCSQEALSVEYRTNELSKNSARMASAFVVCGLMDMVVRWNRENYQMSAQEMAETTLQLLSKPIINDLYL